MNRERTISLYLWCLMIIGLLLSCSVSTPDIAGTGSQAGNSIVVIASAKYSDSTTASQVEVFVRSANFLPAVDSVETETSETTTNADGSLSLYLPRDSIMVIELQDSNGYAHMTYCSTDIDDDTLDLGNISLEQEAVFVGSVDRSTIPDSLPVFVQVYGMNKSVPLNPDGSFRIDHMPPGQFSFRIVPGNYQDPFVDREPVALGPNDTLDVGFFDPNSTPANDTLIIRSILDENGLTGIPVSSVVAKDPEGRIVELDLRSRGIDTIVPEVGKLSLKKMLLGDNNLTMLPPDLEFMNSLEELDLSGNPLSLIPMSVFRLRNLKVLNLNNTELREFHPEIGKLRYLRELYAEKNQLTKLPPEFGLLIDLVTLDLSDNQLSELPIQITYLKRVETLDLNNNKLLALPQEIEQWVTVTTGSESWKSTQQ